MDRQRNPFKSVSYLALWLDDGLESGPRFRNYLQVTIKFRNVLLAYSNSSHAFIFSLSFSIRDERLILVALTRVRDGRLDLSRVSLCSAVRSVIAGLSSPMTDLTTNPDLTQSRILVDLCDVCVSLQDHANVTRPINTASLQTSS